MHSVDSELRDKAGRWSTKRGETMTPVTTQKGQRLLPGGKQLPPHLKRIGIPPAWTDVSVNEDPSGSLFAVGKDAKGRRQSVYSPAWAASQSAQKFKRVLALEKKFQGVSEKNDKLLDSSDPATADSAHALRLIFHTGIRPGSDKDTQAAKKAYGATTLLGKHVRKQEDGVHLRFTGKKGVDLDIPIRDHEIAKDLVKRAGSGPNVKLFPNTTADLLRAHVHGVGGEVKTKDFRTLLANRIARAEVETTPAPKTQKDYVKAVKAVAQKVSQHLGNTVPVALKSYINPEVFGKWKGAIA